MPLNKSSVTVLIPSFGPPDDFPDFIQKLASFGFGRIICVDDGSSEEFSTLFDVIKSPTVIILRHSKNLGKGEALKTGFRYILADESSTKIVVCCDDDGQHHPEDVNKVAESALSNNSSFILGVRSFKAGTPIKSLIGNSFMKTLFFLLTGKSLQDTQTGLRAFHVQYLKTFLKNNLSGFSFETVTLLHIVYSRINLVQVPIRTLYFDKNLNTRFKTIKDSISIIRDVLRSYFADNDEK